MEVRECEITPEAICGHILAENNILDYVKGCWFIPSQPGGAIFPRIVQNSHFWSSKSAKIGQNKAKSSDFGTLK